ncbi:MAG: hypothetical protein JW772_00710 [Candidatus Diapherotrites archaeon]|nr:hypothetical protein [Candidatus Diapherotrites archaeon]
MVEDKKRVVLTGTQLAEAFQQQQGKLEALERKHREIRGLLAEAVGTEESLKEIKKSVKGEKIIVNLGAGVYAEANLISNEKFKTGYAGNLMLNSDYDKTVKYLEEQKAMIQKELDAVLRERENTIAVLNEIGRALQVGQQKAMEAQKQEKNKSVS